MRPFLRLLVLLWLRWLSRRLWVEWILLLGSLDWRLLNSSLISVSPDGLTGVGVLWLRCARQRWEFTMTEEIGNWLAHGAPLCGPFESKGKDRAANFRTSPDLLTSYQEGWPVESPRLFAQNCYWLPQSALTERSVILVPHLPDHQIPSSCHYLTRPNTVREWLAIL